MAAPVLGLTGGGGGPFGVARLSRVSGTLASMPGNTPSTVPPAISTFADVTGFTPVAV